MNTVKNHFHTFYRVLSKQQSQFKGIDRYVTGIPIPYHNVLIGMPEGDVDDCIEEQLQFFQKSGLPFAWYFDADNEPFKQKLLNYHFQDIGVFTGMFGPLNQLFESPDLDIEQVGTNGMDEFNDVICTVFGFTGKGKELFKKALIESPMKHWMLRKNGKGVSVLSTLQEKGMVSIWNEATLPEERRQGNSSHLCKRALNEAMKEGCNTGASYIQSDAMAYGIHSRLGYKPQWNFHVLFSPERLYKY